MTVQDRPPPGKYKLTTADFVRLDEAGVFGTDRTELLDGDIIIMNAEYRPHAWVAGELGYRIRRALEAIGSDLFAMSASVALSEHDMPLPDLVLTNEPRGAGPIPLASVALIVEISASTLDRDMIDKLKIYSDAGVPEYWVVDVDARILRRMWSPAAGRYSQRDDVAFDTPITAATIPGLTIETTDL
jgi:Uma2 family endonuclease